MKKLRRVVCGLLACTLVFGLASCNLLLGEEHGSVDRWEYSGGDLPDYSREGEDSQENSAAECRHKSVKWSVETPSTCSQQGVQVGLCRACGKEFRQSIAVNPNAHSYGEWAVVVPTETRGGLARKACALNPAHDALEIQLPVLSDARYTTSIVQMPTAEAPGIREYTLAHAEGEICFTAELAFSESLTVAEAVDYGTSETSRLLVQQANGTTAWDFYDENNENILGSDGGYTYLVFSNVTTIEDRTSGQEYVYGERNGEAFGLATDPNGRAFDHLHSETGNAELRKGARLYLPYANIEEYYGVEALLRGLYDMGKANANGDFQESVGGTELAPTYAFSFGYVPEPYGTSNEYFTLFNVSFALDSRYVVSTFFVQATTYVNSNDQVDENGNPMRDVKTWAKNTKGYAYVLSGKTNGMRYVSTIEHSQTAWEDGAQEIDLGIETLYVNDFDVYHGERQINVGDTVEIAAGQTTGYAFSLRNVEPTDVLKESALDAPRFYLRKMKNGEATDTLLDEGSYESLGVSAYFDLDTAKFMLCAKASSSVYEIVVKTASVERSFLVKATAKAPTALRAKVYEYSAGGYTWSTATTATVNETVYAYQPFYFTASAIAAEEGSVSTEYTVSVSPKPNVSYTEPFEEEKEEGITEISSILSTSFEGVPVSMFVPEEAKTYTITLTSTLDSTVKATIRLTVQDYPYYEDLCTGRYTGTFEGKTVTVSFSGGSEEYDYEYEDYLYTVTATVSYDGKTEKLYCYGYSDMMLYSEYDSGTELGFILALNEGYDFVLSRYNETTRGYDQTVLSTK